MRRSILRALLKDGAIRSLGEGRRLIENGGVRVDGLKVNSDRMLEPGTYAIKCGNAPEFAHVVPADEPSEATVREPAEAASAVAEQAERIQP